MIKLGNVLLLGDSYTTYKGYIPEGYEAYYPSSITNLTEVGQTWWHKVLSATESKLILNNSWSGAAICNTGYNACNATYKSFVTRLDQLIEENFFENNAVDTVFVLGATNDSWANSPIGEVKWADWTADDLFSFRPAMCYLAKRLSELKVRVIFILNSELKAEINETVSECCERFNIELIKLKQIDKIEGHPGIAGMNKIANQVLQYLEQ